MADRVADAVNAPRALSAWSVVAAVAIVVGGIVRSVEVAQSHAFGFDESLLAINVVTRSLRQLVHPLAFEQTAPVLFLWIDRIVVDLLGVNNVALRLVTLLAGIVTLVLAWVVGPQLVPRPAAALAVALLAISPLAVDYSDRTKPYMVDAAIAVALIAASLRTIRRPDQRRSWLLLSLSGAIGILLSTPALLTLASCAIAIVLALSPAQRRETLRPYAMTMLLCAVVAGVNYIVMQRATTHDPYLRRFWGTAFFVPGAPNLLERVRVVTSSYAQSLFFGTSVRASIIARAAIALLGIGGAVRLGTRTGLWAVVLLAGPLALAVVTSAAQLYPPSDRTWLFAAPGTVLLVTTGLLAVTDHVPHAARVPAFAFAGLALLVLPARQSLLTLHDSLAPDNLERALTAWRSDPAADEPIYVFGRDAVRWTYYTTDWTRPDTIRVDTLLALAHAIGPNSGNAPPRGHAVHDEGDALVYAGSGRRELIGIPTGMEGGILNHPQLEPDTAWADNEARRIAAAAHGGGAWLFFIYCDPPIDSALIAATGRRGGRLASDLLFDNVRLYRIQFAPITPPFVAASLERSQ
jgi:hypothetical protein